MFTGIIENLGQLKEVDDGIYTFLAPKSFCNKLKIGDSVAINGVCLTIEKKIKPEKFIVSIMPETKDRTVLGNLKPKELVNLELPTTNNKFLSGHFVQGHIDGTGKITAIKKRGNSQILTIKTSNKLARHIVEKGSITINGISLTVANSEKNDFSVAIIPYTWENTTINQAKIGDLVNIETDIIAKYLEKILKK